LTCTELQYNGMCKVTNKLRRKQLKFAGHYYSHKGEMASKTISWQLTQGRAKKAGPAATYTASMET